MMVTPFDIGCVLQLGIEPIVFVRLEALDVSAEERVGRSSDLSGDPGAHVALRIHAGPAVGVHLNVGVESTRGIWMVRRRVDHLLTHPVRNAVPVDARSRMPVG